MKRVTPKRWISVLLSLSILLVVVALVCISFGASPIPIREVVGALRDPERLGKVGTILWEIRLPRVLMGAIVGAALASAGVVFQALLRNPLADPYVLGVSGGGAVGAIVAMMLGTSMRFLGFSTITVFAFSGSLLTIFLVYAIGQSRGRIVTHSMLLAGVIVNSLFSAIIMFLTATMDFTKVHGVIFWLMGSLGSADPSILTPLFLYVLLGIGILFYIARDLNLLTLGEEPASHLGVNVERTKRIAFVGASLVTGTVVSVSGLIGFVGLIVPHAMRMLIGPDHRLLLPASALCGAIFLMISDTIARTIIAPTELPVGVITALCGGPFFIVLMRSKLKGLQ